MKHSTRTFFFIVLATKALKGRLIPIPLFLWSLKARTPFSPYVTSLIGFCLGSAAARSAPMSRNAITPMLSPNCNTCALLDCFVWCIVFRA